MESACNLHFWGGPQLHLFKTNIKVFYLMMALCQRRRQNSQSHDGLLSQLSINFSSSWITGGVCRRGSNLHLGNFSCFQCRNMQALSMEITDCQKVYKVHMKQNNYRKYCKQSPDIFAFALKHMQRQLNLVKWDTRGKHKSPRSVTIANFLIRSNAAWSIWMAFRHVVRRVPEWISKHKKGMLKVYPNSMRTVFISPP